MYSGIFFLKFSSILFEKFFQSKKGSYCNTFIFKKTISISTFNFVIPFIRLSTRFDNGFGINLILLIKFILCIFLNIFLTIIPYCLSYHLYQLLKFYFYRDKKSFLLFIIFSNPFKLAFKFFCYLFNDRMIIEI